MVFARIESVMFWLGVLIIMLWFTLMVVLSVAIVGRFVLGVVAVLLTVVIDVMSRMGVLLGCW